MRKLLKIFSLMLILLLMSAPMVVAETGVKSEKKQKFDSVEDLKKYAINDNINIMLYDDNNQIINEFHSDGNQVEYEYKDGKMVKSADSNGGLHKYLYEGEETTVQMYHKGKLYREEKLKKSVNLPKLIIEEKVKKLKEHYKKNLENDFLINPDLSAASTTSYEDYWVNGVLMNDIAVSGPNHETDYFARPTKSQAGIQSFLDGKNSILKNSIQIWRKNSSGTVYNTGQTIIPAAAINNAEDTHWINCKVIIATLQKESSLISAAPGTVPYSDRRFYYAMGYGATDGGDLSGTSGFDIQIDKGTATLDYWWWEAPVEMPVKMTVNNGVDKTSNGVTYKGYIWVKNWGTYSLYKYTPWTIDTNYLPTIAGGNYLFHQIFKGYWGTNWT